MVFRIQLNVDYQHEEYDLDRFVGLTKFAGHKREELEKEFSDMLDYVFGKEEGNEEQD